ncbi:MAG TPA: hypothetical protein VG994_10560 [Steroidobacteraceae bacterium]|nr:hypothetical protein [Steroidobacteraceae bacterium]
MSLRGARAVVLDGVLTENGMLSFKKTLSPEDVEAIRAHLVRLAHDLQKHPEPPFPFGPRPPAPASGSQTPAVPQIGLHQ